MRRFVCGAFSVVVGLAVFVIPVRGQVTFVKSLSKLNGVPISGFPTSLNNGDVLTWVLSYQYNPSPVQQAQTDIRDPLSPVLQYVSGSLQVPPSWTKQWSNGGNWGPTEPAVANGVGAVISFPNVTPIGAGQ